MKRINLATDKGIKELEDGIRTHGETEPHLMGSGFVEFMQTFDHPLLCCGDAHVLLLPGCFNVGGAALLLRNRRFYVSCNSGLFWNMPGSVSSLNFVMETVGGVLITDCEVRHGESTKSFRGLVLVNGDTDDEYDSNNLNNIFDDYDFPTVSYACLARFFKSGNITVVVKKLCNGELVVKDFTCDESVALNAQEKKLMKKKDGRSMLAPPGSGFTLMGNDKDAYWHRPGFVLIDDVKSERSLLFGQDGETYFGCQLQFQCDTVAEALDSLIPREARRGDVMRQGEWFLVPVPAEDVPATEDSVLLFDTDSGSVWSVWLPMPNEGNEHFIRTEDGRVGKDGVVYALDPTLNHDEHGDLEVSGWHKFVRNTAVVSFSQEGVD